MKSGQEVAGDEYGPQGEEGRPAGTSALVSITARMATG